MFDMFRYVFQTYIYLEGMVLKPDSRISVINTFSLYIFQLSMDFSYMYSFGYEIVSHFCCNQS